MNGDQESELQLLIEELRPFCSAFMAALPKTTLTEGLLYAVGTLLSPTELLHGRSIENWILLLDRMPYSMRPRRVHAFAFVLGLDNISQKGHELIKRTFDLLHTAAERSELAFECWRLIRDYLPELPLHKKWDKCERIRRAVIRAYIVHGWPAAFFLQTTLRPEILEDLLRTCERTDEGRELLAYLNRIDLSAVPTQYQNAVQRIKKR
jgi:hypothetical protein